ncbi:MAG TPA: dienelactone hydrolase family protein [Diaminobutyricibacter sp.]|jgi:carboxymethylenebutenolidase
MTAPAPTVVAVDIPSDVDGTSEGLRGVMAIPAGEGPWPGVILVHEAFDINDNMRRQVQRMAEAGYLAIMPDLFSQGGARKCLMATFRALSTGRGRAFQDIEAARRMLLARPDTTEKVGVIGFCMGGGFALALASGRRYDVSSVNYGRFPKDADAVLADACPVVASYGGRDRSLTNAAAKLDALLTRNGIPHDVKEYPHAGHSFLNEEEEGAPALRPVMRMILGAGPNPEAAADAWARIEAFFGEYLR